MICIKESSICDWRRKYILSIQLLHTTVEADLQMRPLELYFPQHVLCINAILQILFLQYHYRMTTYLYRMHFVKKGKKRSRKNKPFKCTESQVWCNIKLTTFNWGLAFIYKIVASNAKKVILNDKRSSLHYLFIC